MRGHRRATAAVTWALLAPALAACAGDTDDAPPPLPTLVALPELTLGADLDAPPERQLHDILDVLVLDDGSLWVVDGDDTRLVRRYGSDGAFIGHVSREGDGPGEFRSPYRLSQLRDGRVAVLDAARPGRVMTFDPSGRWIETVVLDGAGTSTRAWDDPAGIVLDREGRVWLPLEDGSEGEASAPSVAGDRSGPGWVRFDLDAPSGAPDTIHAPAANRLVPADPPPPGAVRAPYTPRLEIVVGPWGDLWAAWTGRYRIHRVEGAPVSGPPGDARVVLDRSGAEALPVPEGERRQARAALASVVEDFHEPGTRVPDVPALKPLLREFSVTPGGMLIVRPHAPSRLEGGEWVESTPVDVYEIPDRVRPVGRLELDGEHEVFDARDGRLWTLHRDSLGIESIRSYRWEPGPSR